MITLVTALLNLAVVAMMVLSAEGHGHRIRTSICPLPARDVSEANERRL